MRDFLTLRCSRMYPSRCNQWMAPRTGVLLMFKRSASSASSIHVPGESLPCTINSLISRNAVSKLVPCSAFALGLAALRPSFFFIGNLAAVGNEMMLQ